MYIKKSNILGFGVTLQISLHKKRNCNVAKETLFSGPLDKLYCSYQSSSFLILPVLKVIRVTRCPTTVSL